MPHLHAEYGKRNAAAQELLQEGDGGIDEAGLHNELGQVGQAADQTCMDGGVNQEKSRNAGPYGTPSVLCSPLVITT